MKLVKQTKDGWQYQLNQPEANCLRSLLFQFPITANVPGKNIPDGQRPANR